MQRIIQFCRGDYTVLPDDDKKRIPKSTKRENVSISNSLYAMGWKSFLSVGLSIGELIFTTISISLLENLYDDYEHDNNPALHLLYEIGSIAMAKTLEFANDYITLSAATEESSVIAEQIADDYFSSSLYHDGDAPKVGRLIFDSFDIIRPTLVIIHNKVIFKFLEMIAFASGLVVAKECDIEDVILITGISIVADLFIYYLENKSGRLSSKQQDYLKAYEDVYGYISTTVGNYETVKVFDAKSKLIKDIRNKVSAFSEKIDRTSHGLSIAVKLTDLVTFLSMTVGTAVLARKKGYKGNKFVYLFLFALEQSLNLKEFSEAFFKIGQSRASFQEIDKYIGEHKSVEAVELKENFHSIEFSEVKFGRFYNLNLSVQSGEKIIVEGPSGCGKSSILKLLSGLLSLRNYGYDLTLFSMDSNSDLEMEVNRLRKNKEFQDKPILIKRGDDFSVNGFDLKGEWKTKSGLNPNKFKGLKFSEEPEVLEYGEIPKDVYDEIELKQGHVINSGNIIIKTTNNGFGATGDEKVESVNVPRISNLRNYVTYIHAETQIFPYSLEDNIKIADANLFINENTTSEVKKAADRAELSEEYSSENYKDPNKITTLSTGQKKRVGLARLFLKPTDILLIDEPLSGLDINVAERFMSKLLDIINSSSKTVMVIEHREEFKKNTFIRGLFTTTIKFEDSGKIRLFRKNNDSIIGYWRPKLKETKEEVKQILNNG